MKGREERGGKGSGGKGGGGENEFKKKITGVPKNVLEKKRIKKKSKKKNLRECPRSRFPRKEKNCLKILTEGVLSAQAPEGTSRYLPWETQNGATRV
jgi:hypothetical protein